MLPRSLSLLRVGRVLSRLQASRCYGSEVAHHGPTSVELAQGMASRMDDITIPQGSWQEANNQRQKRYNIQLVFNSVLMVAMWYVSMYVLETYSLHGPPKSLEGINIYEKNDDEDDEDDEE